MPSMIFRVINLLDQKRIHYTIMRTSVRDTTIIATMVGRRVEICVDEDEMVDVAVFTGNEDVAVGMDALERALADEE